MNKVEIIRTEGADRDSGMRLTKRISVRVDGAIVGGGHFGGEPEDNYEFRDYAWVIPLIRRLALLVDVDTTETIRDDE